MQPTTTNWHSVRTIAMIALVFIIAGIQAIGGMTPWGDTISAILPVLLFIEHILEGNSGTPTS